MKSVWSSPWRSSGASWKEFTQMSNWATACHGSEGRTHHEPRFPVAAAEVGDSVGKDIPPAIRMAPCACMWQSKHPDHHHLGACCLNPAQGAKATTVCAVSHADLSSVKSACPSPRPQDDGNHSLGNGSYAWTYFQRSGKWHPSVKQAAGYTVGSRCPWWEGKVSPSEMGQFPLPSQLLIKEWSSTLPNCIFTEKLTDLLGENFWFLNASNKFNTNTVSQTKHTARSGLCVISLWPCSMSPFTCKSHNILESGYYYPLDNSGEETEVYRDQITC